MKNIIFILLIAIAGSTFAQKKKETSTSESSKPANKEYQ